MEQIRILIVDDNPEIREIIRILLKGEGYEISEAADGEAALHLLLNQAFDLIILDIMMPRLNGYQTCVQIRHLTNAPILFLSAKTQESDKTLGFSSGGDDYLAKPFSYSELVSRTKALIRRYHIYRGKQDAADTQTEPACSNDRHKRISVRNLEVEPDTRSAWIEEKRIELTDTEYELLLLFVTHRGQIFSAERLYESVWNEPYYYGANNTIMVHIRNLRRKIEKDPANPLLIRTIWGRGYRCDS